MHFDSKSYSLDSHVRKHDQSYRIENIYWDTNVYRINYSQHCSTYKDSKCLLEITTWIILNNLKKNKKEGLTIATAVVYYFIRT
jgi:hypothetical protein